MVTQILCLGTCIMTVGSRVGALLAVLSGGRGGMIIAKAVSRVGVWACPERGELSKDSKIMRMGACGIVKLI
ncbi:hypothetical protein GGR55DRAFT_672757 [Xylaria sp. FL0064]|nr:hypothetical protein GGR55DRAFT_672757 [Xylaria sp. FL0064]